MSDKLRDCDWCCHGERPGYVQIVEDGPWTVCHMCKGTLKIEDVCYCFAHEPSECCCNADWNDHVYWED